MNKKNKFCFEKDKKLEKLIKEITLQYNRETGEFHTQNRGGYSDPSVDLDEALKDFEAIARSEFEEVER